MKTKYDAIFSAYIDAERPKMERPFVYGDNVVATNGHIACKVPTSLCGDTYEQGKLDAVEKVFSYPVPFAEPVEFQAADLYVTDPDLLKLLTPQIEDCDNCRGTGTCDRCHCETEHDCGDCDGRGESLCPPESNALFMGAAFTYRYLQTIFDTANALNGGKFQVVGRGDKGSQLFLFKILDCEIVLMPCTGNKGINLEKSKSKLSNHLAA